MKQLSCGDVVAGCGRTFGAGDEETLLREAVEHALADHGPAECPADLADLVEALRARVVTA